MPGPVESEIRKKVREGTELATLERNAPFTLAEFEDEDVVLRVGERQARTTVSWKALEDLPLFLVGRGWVQVGGSFDPKATAGTVDSYLKEHASKATGGQVAALLEAAGLVEVERGKPVKVRLSTSSAAVKASQPAAPSLELKQSTRRLEEHKVKPDPRRFG